MYLTEELLEKLNGGGNKKASTLETDADRQITLADIMVLSSTELRELADDRLTWGEQHFLYQHAQQKLKDNKMWPTDNWNTPPSTKRICGTYRRWIFLAMIPGCYWTSPPLGTVADQITLTKVQQALRLYNLRHNLRHSISVVRKLADVEGLYGAGHREVPDLVRCRAEAARGTR